MDPPKRKFRRSVSQLSSFSRCPEGFRLERIAKAPKQPAAWFAQGIAVHKALEVWERSLRTISTNDLIEIFHSEYDRLIAEDMSREPDLKRWLTGGRTKAEDDISRRRERGPGLIEGYIKYSLQAQEIPLMLVPGEPAIETEFRIFLDGIEVIGFIDIIQEWPDGRITPRDWKAGSKKPDWELQLGIYKVAIEELYGIPIEWGDFYMLKEERPDRPVNLTRFTRPFVTQLFHELAAAIDAEAFLPNPGDACRTCTVKDFCRALGHRSNEFPLRDKES